MNPTFSRSRRIGLVFAVALTGLATPLALAQEGATPDSQMKGVLDAHDDIFGMGTVDLKAAFGN